MSRTAGLTAGWFWVGIVALETAAFSLACRLAAAPAAAPPASPSLAAALLGDSRAAIGAAFYEQADTAFHKGVGHYRAKGIASVFVALGREIAPEAHVHLTGGDVKDIVPWLYFATRMDAGNVTAYGVAAFWLAGQAGRPDLAERVLSEARRANPRDYRVYLESGRLAIKQSELKRAAAFLETAMRLWPGASASPDRQNELDLAEIQMYRGLLYEHDGALAQAREMYRRALERAPDRPALRQRLDYLEAHGRSPSPPFEAWRDLLYRHAEVCDREGAEENHRH